MIRITLGDSSRGRLKALRRTSPAPEVRDLIEMVTPPTPAGRRRASGLPPRSVRDLLRAFLARGTAALYPFRSGPACTGPDAGAQVRRRGSCRNFSPRLHPIIMCDSIRSLASATVRRRPAQVRSRGCSHKRFTTRDQHHVHASTDPRRRGVRRDGPPRGRRLSRRGLRQYGARGPGHHHDGGASRPTSRPSSTRMTARAAPRGRCCGRAP
jgi:hypothetical protein